MNRGDIVVVAADVERHFGTGASRVSPVDGVHLELRAGDLVTLGGPSGSGKSTLLHLLTGFDRCDAGTITWEGVTDGSPPPWSVVSIVPQSLGLLAELTYAENISTPLLLSGMDKAAAGRALVDVMDELDIGHLRHRLPAETSLGQQQRAAIARAIVQRPAVLLADEPTSHQDAAHGDVVMRAIRQRVDAGSACLIAGHDPRLETIADRRYELVGGRLHELSVPNRGG